MAEVTEITIKTLPTALQRHTRAMYEAMLLEAVLEEGGELVYSGYITKTYQATGGSHVYQGDVLRILRDYNCIAVERVGMRNTPTRALMLNHPDDAAIPAEEWARRKSPQADLTRRAEFDKLAQSVRNIAAQVGGVNLGELVAGIHAELGEIKTRLDKLEHKA